MIKFIKKILGINSPSKCNYILKHRNRGKNNI